MSRALSRLRSLRAELRDARVRHMLLLPFTLPFALRRFYADRPTVADARASLRRELATREARFLAVARTRIYGAPRSPYARLMKHAGCELGDLEAGIRRDGLETTLVRLARDGVYLTPAEFKGKTDVVRGALTFCVRPEDLDPRRGVGARDIPPGFVTQSSGSSDHPVRSMNSVAWLAQHAPAFAVFVAAHGLFSHRHAVYEPALPGAGIVVMIMLARFGIACTRWFAQPVPLNGWLEGAYFRVTAREIALAGRRFGPGFANPEPVPAAALDRIVRWVVENRREGRPTAIRTVASNAARIARVALAVGASLEGCTFIASGEPLTGAKRRVIEQAGARVTVFWGYEPGPVTVGLGCARPAHGDDMHVVRHSVAVIEHPVPVAVAGEALHPLLFTTLYPTVARLQLNVSNGDCAVLSGRPCGCALEDAGLTLHVHQVGSFEKFTSEGLALVDPGVGPIDEPRLRARLASALAAGSRGNRFMTGVWKDAGTLRVRREAPMASARGKILPLRIASRRRGSTEPSPDAASRGP